jgi:hypothetical protein
MRTHLAVALVLLLSTQAVAADGPQVSSQARVRGWVTSLGVGLLGVGVAGLGLGVGSLLNAADADHMLSAYYPPAQAAPTTAEAPTVTQLAQRRSNANLLGIVSLIAGGVAVAGGLTCVLLDGSGGPAVQAAVVPGPGGGALVLSGRF